MDKKVKKSTLAILITFVVVELISYTGYFGAEKFEYSYTYMLLYLCINEVLKEN